MARQRSQRKLVNDRLDRCVNATTENIRRLEEIEGMYAEGESINPGGYIKLMAMVDALRNAEIGILDNFKLFRELGKP